MCCRPPPLLICCDESEDVRCDIDDDVKKIYPNLPVGTSWAEHAFFVKEREKYMNELDMCAYLTIMHVFPLFKPIRLHNMK